jgi:hypothetical protein
MLHAPYLSLLALLKETQSIAFGSIHQNNPKYRHTILVSGGNPSKGHPDDDLMHIQSLFFLS